MKLHLHISRPPSISRVRRRGVVWTLSVDAVSFSLASESNALVGWASVFDGSRSSKN